MHFSFRIEHIQCTDQILAGIGRFDNGINITSGSCGRDVLLQAAEGSGAFSDGVGITVGIEKLDDTTRRITLEGGEDLADFSL